MLVLKFFVSHKEETFSFEIILKKNFRNNGLFSPVLNSNFNFLDNGKSYVTTLETKLLSIIWEHDDTFFLRFLFHLIILWSCLQWMLFSCENNSYLSSVKAIMMIGNWYHFYKDCRNTIFLLYVFRLYFVSLFYHISNDFSL